MDFCELLSFSPLWDPVISHLSHSTRFSPGRLEESFILLAEVSLGPHCVPPNILGTCKENHILFLFRYRNAKLGGKNSQRQKMMNEMLERILDTIHNGTYLVLNTPFCDFV